MPANSIASTVYQIISVLAYGAASAACIITGKTVGSGKSELVKGYARTMQIIFLAIGVVTGLALFCLRGPILSLYKITEGTRALAYSFLTVLSVTVVGTSYQVAVLTGIVREGRYPFCIYKRFDIYVANRAACQRGGGLLAESFARMGVYLP